MYVELNDGWRDRGHLCIVGRDTSSRNGLVLDSPKSLETNLAFYYNRVSLRWG